MADTDEEASAITAAVIGSFPDTHEFQVTGPFWMAEFDVDPVPETNEDAR